jgi:uncharacterized glyoxalase superfamily protein PhnB
MVAMDPFLTAQKIWPTIQAHDAPALIEFLVGTLDFTKIAVYMEGEAYVAHAELAAPDGGVVMLGSHKPGAGWSTPPGTAGISVYSADPDALYSKAKAAGVEIIREITDEDYGARGFGLQDPEGNLWYFSTYQGENPTIKNDPGSAG